MTTSKAMMLRTLLTHCCGLILAAGVATAQAPATPTATTSPDKAGEKPAVGAKPSPASSTKSNSAKAPTSTAAVSTMNPEELRGFEEYPADVQELVRKCLALTTKNLRYQFGSSDPKAGGMDCSGTVYCVLRDSGMKDVPRQSNEMCRWVMRRTVLFRTENVVSLNDPAFSELKPGDLLFWTGTYETSTPREIPISHVMIYLGRRDKDGKPVVFGASDGRTYENQRRNGVSVFDFALPRRGSKAALYGYGPVPGLDGTAQAIEPHPVASS